MLVFGCVVLAPVVVIPYLASQSYNEYVEKCEMAGGKVIGGSGRSYSVCIDRRVVIDVGK